MTLEELLMPGEDVKYRSATTVQYGASPYTVFVTNRRFILYQQRGMLFRKDDMVSWGLDEIKKASFQESGLIMKKGILRIETRDTIIQLESSSASMKSIYQQSLQWFAKPVAA